jgi:hypothetical protein
MESPWFEFIVKILVLVLFAALILASSCYSYFTLVRGWTGKPSVDALAQVAVSATISLLVVLVLKYTSGDITLEIWQLRFNGATGPSLLWIFCFIALIFGFDRLTRQK